MRVILIGTVVFSISGVVMSALQANQHFFLPALAPIMYNLGILFGVVVLAPTLGVWGPAIGVVIGSVLHLLIQVPGLIKYKAQWTARLGWHDAPVRRVGKLMIPRILGLGAVQAGGRRHDQLSFHAGGGQCHRLELWLARDAAARNVDRHRHRYRRLSHVE